MTNLQAAEEFKKLLDTSDVLLGPEGCPWDRDQTLVSMRQSILEEACEVIEAIDEGDDHDLIEELGDLMYNIVFFSKLAEKEGRFSTPDPIMRIREKLVNRHPHVFGDKKIHDAAGVAAQWEEIKKVEKSDRESLMDGIPLGLPALARAYKVAGQMDKANYEPYLEDTLFENEEELGSLLWEIILQARKRKINPEMALRKEMVDQIRAFRQWEDNGASSSQRE